MRARIVAAGVLTLLLGCTAATVPVASPTQALPTEPLGATAPPAGAPAQLRPLPEAVAGRPRPGQASVVVGPATQRVGLQLGTAYPYALGHCGLFSPFDLDGSLWDPVAGHDGAGGPLTEPQRGELINQPTGTVTLVTPDVAEFRTPLGAVVTLVRLPGERAYSLCD